MSDQIMTDLVPITIKNRDELIPFVNMIMEISNVIEDEYIADWITTHHNFLGKTPLQEFNDTGMVKVFDLLTLIERDEADIID